MNFYGEMLKEKGDQIKGLKTLIESSTERALNTSNVKKNVSVQLDEGEGILVRLFAVEVEAMLISVSWTTSWTLITESKVGFCSGC